MSDHNVPLKRLSSVSPRRHDLTRRQRWGLLFFLVRLPAPRHNWDCASCPRVLMARSACRTSVRGHRTITSDWGEVKTQRTFRQTPSFLRLGYVGCITRVSPLTPPVSTAVQTSLPVFKSHPRPHLPLLRPGVPLHPYRPLPPLAPSARCTYRT